MADYVVDRGEALDWDDEASFDGGFTLLPEGTYQFMVVGFERKRFEGSDYTAPCPKAELTLTVMTETGLATVKDSILLNTKSSWRAARFFEALGFVKNAETGKMPMKWNEIEGKSGWLELGIRDYTSNGQKRQINNVNKYLSPSEWPEQPQQATAVNTAQQPAYVQTAAQQPAYQQSQMPMPQQQPQYQHPNQGYVM